MSMLDWLAEVYILSNFWGFKPPLYCLLTETQTFFSGSAIVECEVIRSLP